MDITISKPDLIARLNEKRKEAEQYDKKNLAAHRKDEDAQLAKFRARLRDALKWDRATAAKNRFEAGLDYSERNVSCPRSKVAEYDKALDGLLLDSRAKFTIRRGTDLGNLVFWSPSPSSDDVC